MDPSGFVHDPTLADVADWIAAHEDDIVQTLDHIAANGLAWTAQRFAKAIVTYVMSPARDAPKPPQGGSFLRNACLVVFPRRPDTRARVRLLIDLLGEPNIESPVEENPVGLGKGGHRPFPEQFSTPLRKVLTAVSLSDKPVVLGSNEDHQIMYSADYDLTENVPLRASSVKAFQALVKRACRIGTVTDIKCGEIAAWNLLRDKHYSQAEEVKTLSHLWQTKIITDAEFQAGKKCLKPHLTIPEKLRARKELRFGVLRWTPADVARGSLHYRGHTFLLSECFMSKGITKVDVVAWVKDKYIEVSNIILWTKGGKPYAQLRPLKDALAEDIVLYEEEGNWVKVAKRMLSIAKEKHYITDEKKLRRLLNSPLGAVYTVVSDLDLLAEFPNAVTPAKKREELDWMRDRMAKLFFPEFDHATNPQALLPKLRDVMNAKMKSQLTVEHLLPIRKDYRPSPRSS